MGVVFGMVVGVVGVIMFVGGVMMGVVCVIGGGVLGAICVGMLMGLVVLIVYMFGKEIVVLLFMVVGLGADQLIAANAVGVRPTFPHRYAIEQTKAYFCKLDCIQTCPRKLHNGAPHHGPHGPEPLPWCSRFKPK